MCRKINFNFTAASTATWIVNHVFIKSGNSIIIWSRPTIKHYCVFRFEILTDSLIKPFVTIDFSIIPLFDSKYEIDPSTLQSGFINSKIPSADLEKMQNIFRDLLNARMNDMLHLFHFPYVISIFEQELLSLENFCIKELILGSKLSERFRDCFIPVCNTDHNKVMLLHSYVWVHMHYVIVLKNAFHGCPEVIFIFTGHSDANCKLGKSLSDDIKLLHS